MTTYANSAEGMRGVNMKDGSTVWIDAGASADINDADIEGPLGDGIAKAGKTAKAPKADAAPVADGSAPAADAATA